jgi:nucleotide-binding universal stress UspA family protein
MTIVCAIDFSAPATLAADLAARLARALGDELVLLHVAERGDDLTVLDREVERLSAVVPTQLRVRQGPVVPAVEEQVAELRARYVVVGAQGVGERALLGTVATALASRSPVPLFVARAPEKLFGFLDRERALRVVLPHGRDDSFGAARDALIELSRLGPIAATLVHAPEVGGPLVPEAKAELAHDVRESVGPVPGVDVETCVVDQPGGVAERLVATIREQRPDLVVCGTHQRRGTARLVMGSVASALVRESPCTVLVAPLR